MGEYIKNYLHLKRFPRISLHCMLNIPLFKPAVGQRTFYYRTIGLWNNVDPFLKSSRSVQVFKRILKNKLLDNFVNTS